MNNTAIYSTMIRAGKCTFFIDLRESKNGKKYIQISESSLNGEKRKRSVIRVFGESIEPFRQAITEAAGAISA